MLKYTEKLVEHWNISETSLKTIAKDLYLKVEQQAH